MTYYVCDIVTYVYVGMELATYHGTWKTSTCGKVCWMWAWQRRMWLTLQPIWPLLLANRKLPTQPKAQAVKAPLQNPHPQRNKLCQTRLPFSKKSVETLTAIIGTWVPLGFPNLSSPSTTTSQGESFSPKRTAPLQYNSTQPFRSLLWALESQLINPKLYFEGYAGGAPIRRWM